MSDGCLHSFNILDIFETDERMTVSIIIPVFNGAEHVPECVKCLSEQEYQDFEVVFVVDSKTTDGSTDVIHREAMVLPAYRVVNQTDSERVSGARNLGIRESRGDLIWFLDIDDHPYSDFLSRLVAIQSETGADIVFCNHIHETKRVVPEVPERDYRVTVCTGTEAVSRFTSFPVYPWSRIQRRSMFDTGEILFHNHLTAEDIEQTILSLAVADKVAYYNRPLYVYYKVRGSFSSRNRSKEAEAMNEIARRSMEFVERVRPESVEGFRRQMLERLMRQMAFVKYSDYKDAYAVSVAHDYLKDIEDRTMEMNVFSRSKLVYYMVLYPFTHWIWDNKTGLWDERV